MKNPISQFFSDPFITAVIIIIGLILSIAGFIQRSSLLALIGIKTSRSVKRIVLYGLGGVGKTTLIDRMLHGPNVRNFRTLTIDKKEAIVTRFGKTYYIETIDPVGQNESDMRIDLIEEYRENGDKIQVLIIVLSFYPIEGKTPNDTKLIIPENKQEKDDVINNHCDAQNKHFNEAVLKDLIYRIYGLQCVYLVFNHMDILYHKNIKSRLQFAESKFLKIIDSIKAIRKEKNLSIWLDNNFISAECGIEYKLDNQKVEPIEISILNDILEKIT